MSWHGKGYRTNPEQKTKVQRPGYELKKKHSQILNGRRQWETRTTFL